MRRVRSLFAVVICSAALVATPGVVSAGEFPTSGSLDATCNPTTGLLDVTLEVTSNREEALVLGEGFFESEDEVGTDTDGPLPAFDPSTLPSQGSSSTVAFSVPGTTVYLFVSWEIGTQGRSGGQAELDPIEPCTAVPTTSTIPDTVPDTAPESTPAARAVAAAASPRFTG